MSLTAVLPVAAAAALAMGRAPNDDMRAGAVEVEGQRIPYRLVVPAEIEPGRAYPLVLFLHGAGGGRRRAPALPPFAAAEGAAR